MQLRVMTFNLRFENDTDLSQPWEMRKHLIKEIIIASEPDILGTQEGKLRQLSYLDVALKEYEIQMPHRTLDPFSQYPTLFIKQKFLVTKSAEKWLSNSPDIHLSKDWDSAFPRMLSYAYVDIENLGESIVFAVTHLDNKGVIARQMQAQIIKEWAKGIGQTVVLMGDFNENPSGNVHRILCEEGGFLDTWQIAGKKEDEESFSFHGFTGKGCLGRIDWVIIKPSSSVAVEVKDVKFIKVSKGDLMPSDHFPYVVDLKLWHA